MKKLIPAVAFVFAVMALSSCNRGMGCPNNFSIDVDQPTAVIEIQGVELDQDMICK